MDRSSGSRERGGAKGDLNLKVGLSFSGFHSFLCSKRRLKFHFSMSQEK